MRISELMSSMRSVAKALTLALALPAVVAWTTVPAGAEPLTFKTPGEALKQGIGAYAGGYYEMAIPALKAASEGKEAIADFYLARIYADNTGAHTNHALAYDLYRRIADEYADVDPDDDPRAPFVGKALTALAGYLIRGLPEIGLKPNPELAADYLYNASATFNDDDAQFELAKLQLKGEGVEQDVSKAKHWLATLSRKGHAGAQAFLADLMWRGLHMEANPGQALALISVAAANAPSQDRLWIEDILQNIYCGSGEGIRRQANGIVAGWGNRYISTRKPEVVDRSGLGALDVTPVRTCQNGEAVQRIEIAPSVGVALDPARADHRTILRDDTKQGLRDIGAPVHGDSLR
jgi:hypothetical protein